MISIDPYPKVCKLRIVLVYHTVAVFVKLGKSFKTLGRCRTVLKRDLISEKLTAVVDFAVAISIKSKEAVLASYPRSLLRKTVFIKIKMNAIIQAC